jgi:uncharacterized protein with PIN domain
MPPRRAGTTKFAVDAMLGSLSRKLRSFGFDTLYYKEGGDSEMLGICRRQRRILVTADRLLSKRAERMGLPVLLVTGRMDGSRISNMIEVARQRSLALRKGEPRCSLCNGKMRLVSAREAEKIVPTAVARRHRSFYRCTACGNVYWRGSHWKKLRRLARLFES